MYDQSRGRRVQVHGRDLPDWVVKMIDKKGYFWAEPDPIARTFHIHSPADPQPW